MTKFYTLGEWTLNHKKFIRNTVFLSIISAFLLVIIMYIYLPLNIDAGWFSYPALALSRGGDPGENQLNYDELENIEGVKASFNFDTRKSVRIIPLSWWLKLIGSNNWLLRIYGILEWIVLLMLSFLVLRKININIHIAMLCWAILILDDVLIFQGSTCMRPDLMIGIMTLFVFYVSQHKEKAFRILLFILGILAMSLLGTMHATAAIPIAFLNSYLFAELFFNWKNHSGYHKILFITLIVAGMIGFALRFKISNFLLPTQIPVHTAIDVEGRVMSHLSRGPLHLLGKELTRWKVYFFISNIGEFLAVFLGVFLMFFNFFRSSDKITKFTLLSLLVGCLGAMGVLVLNPHPWAQHALPIVPFFIVILAKALDATRNLNVKYTSVALLVIFIFISMSMKLLSAGNNVVKGEQTGFNNFKFVQTFDRIFDDKDRDYIVIGPTEVWPYIDQNMNVVIIDNARGEETKFPANLMNKIDYVILNNDYRDYHWEIRFKMWCPGKKIETITEIGDPQGDWSFIKILKPISDKN